MKKLTVYFLKTKNGNLACCSKTGTPLMDINKKRLEDLFIILKEKDLRYSECKIVKLKETFF